MDQELDGLETLEPCESSIHETNWDYESPEQLAKDLITLSLLPNSRWANLLILDTIKVFQDIISSETMRRYTAFIGININDLYLFSKGINQRNHLKCQNQHRFSCQLTQICVQVL